MVVGGAAAPPDVNNIMGGMEHTAPGVRMHNHRRKLRQRFDLVRKLGQGTYGKVQLGVNKETGQEVAIKTIKKAKIETEADLIRIRREIQIMSSVRHPNIIHIYEVFENKEKMVLVMEYAAGGELYDYLSQRKVLSESEARRVFRQVASAVYYCHKHKICHRDLKLENILLDENKSAKIADFGLSNVFDERRLLTTFCGSPLYASPEIVRGTPYHGPEVDCWSLGVLLYTLVYGAMPFDGSNFKRLVKQISSGDYYEPADKPSTASTLIRQMLLVDPVKRATVEDICSHWWVNESYGESCLEVAEELANQTPVRLDLLLTILPPVESAETVVVDPKQLVDERNKEGDSMNEYLSSKAEENLPPPTAPPETSCSIKATEPETTIKTASKKNKKEPSKEEHQNKADAAAPKRRKSEACTTSADPQESIQSIESPANSVSPIDDSGIQSEQQQPPIQQDPAPPEAEVVPIIKDVDMVMQVDEGFSTAEASSIDVIPEKEAMIISNPADDITDAHPAQAPQPSVDIIRSLNSVVDLGPSNLIDSLSPPPPPPPPPEPHSSITSSTTLIHPPISPSAGPTESHQQHTEIPKNPVGVELVPTAPEIHQPMHQPKNDEVVVVPIVNTRPESAVIRRINAVAVDNNNHHHQQQQQRQSKILRQAVEMFSNNAITSPPKSTMTLERPKKVIIYDFKLATSDSRRAFEAKALEQHSNKVPNVVPVIKVSDAKKAFESSAAAAAAAAAASTAVKPERPSGTTNHHSLPRRTLIQTPASSIETVNKPLGLQPGEKVLVGGLGVKIGAVGKVTEIGMKVKTEEPPKKSPQKPVKTKEIQVMLDTGESEPKVASMIVPDNNNEDNNRPTSPPLLVRPNPPAPVNPVNKPVKKPSSILPNKKINKEPLQQQQQQPAVMAPPPRLTSPPPQIALMALARALSPPPAAQGIVRAFSPPPAAVRALSPPPTDGAEAVLAGSENAFIRSIRSPTKETNKVLQKAEISIPVSATSLTTTPRERIIPIRVESREGSQESSRIPQRILSPPPPPPPIKTVALNRQESVQSPVEESNKKKALPPPPNRELIRKSPREFIIPITVEKGDGSSTVTSSATNTSAASSGTTTTTAHHRNLRKKINDALLSETDTADSLMMNGITSHPASPLQRLSSFKKFYEDHHPTGRARLGSSSSHGDDDDDDDDDDDTFQILTAESLFSTLLSRVRQLTKRSQKMDNNDPLLSSVFRNSRFGSPAPSSSSNRSGRTAGYEQQDQSSTIGSPASCASPDPTAAGSSLLISNNKPSNNWNNNAYSRASSIASETDARRYSGTPDQSNPVTAPWRSREPSVLDDKRVADRGRVARVTLSLHVGEPYSSSAAASSAQSTAFMTVGTPSSSSARL